MTRSSCRRRNRNARAIVAAYPSSLLADHAVAFDADSARRAVLLYAENLRKIRTPPSWTLREVAWPLVAELLNRRAT